MEKQRERCFFVRHLGERPSRFQLAVAVLAFAGIGIVTTNVGGDISAGGLLAMVLGALSWAVGNVLSKPIGKVNMFALVVWGSLMVPLPTLALSFLVEGADRIVNSLSVIRWNTLGAIVYLINPTTLLGLSAWNWLLSRYPAPALRL
jgi:O-acetylserine/cysteine efflux transporter